MIRHLLTAIFAAIAITTATAQSEPTYKREIGVGVGMTNYIGDFNGSLTKGMQPQASLIYRRVFTPYTALKFDLAYTQIKGESSNAESYYPAYDSQKCAFKHNLFDLNVAYEYNFWPYGTGNDYRGAVRLTPYILIGLGATLATGGEKNAFTANLPIGLGLKYKIAQRVNLGIEWAFHATLSDKLDGIEDPYGIPSTGIFKNTDCYSTLRATITYSFSANCPACNKDR